MSQCMLVFINDDGELDSRELPRRFILICPTGGDTESGELSSVEMWRDGQEIYGTIWNHESEVIGAELLPDVKELMQPEETTP